jgi:hypothetical protein
MSNPATQNLRILHDTKEWSTDLDGEIGEVRIDGHRLNDIHDVATKLDVQRKEQIIIAIACTAVVVCTLIICTSVLATVWRQ